MLTTKTDSFVKSVGWPIARLTTRKENNGASIPHSLELVTPHDNDELSGFTPPQSIIIYQSGIDELVDLLVEAGLVDRKGA